jgi:hypothetical protein
MSTIAPAHPNTVPAIRPRAAAGRVTRGRVAFVLVLRLAGFAAVQALIAGLYALRGAADPWAASVAWWPLVAVIVSLLTAAVLTRAARREGLRYTDLLSISRGTARRDLLGFLVVMLLSGPLAYLPMQWLSAALFGDPQAASALMFQPLPPAWAAFLFIAFPLAVALTELPAYFGYVMPRLEALSGRSDSDQSASFLKGSLSAAVLLPVFFLAAQHATLPLIFDWRFIVWRVVMFLPFALLLGIALHRRPTLMPYLMAGHFFIDLSSAYFFLIL